MTQEDDEARDVDLLHKMARALQAGAIWSDGDSLSYAALTRVLTRLEQQEADKETLANEICDWRTRALAADKSLALADELARELQPWMGNPLNRGHTVYQAVCAYQASRGKDAG
jgi:hypothetical protein